MIGNKLTSGNLAISALILIKDVMNINKSISKSKVILICVVLSLILLTKLLWRFYECQMSWFSLINSIQLLVFLILPYLSFLAICFWPCIWLIPKLIDTPHKQVSIGINTLIFYGLSMYALWLPAWLFISFAFAVGLPKFSIYLQFLFTLIIFNICFWKNIPRRDLKIAFIPWVISMLYCFAILLSYIPHTTPENFKARARDFEAVVAMVNTGELNKQIDIPCRYKYLYKSINIELEKDTTVIDFVQMYYGLGDGAEYIIYRSDNLSPVDKHNNLIVEVVKLKPHWFWMLAGS